jgi:hypothetical protein
MDVHYNGLGGAENLARWELWQNGSKIREGTFVPGSWAGARNKTIMFDDLIINPNQTLTCRFYCYDNNKLFGVSFSLLPRIKLLNFTKVI